MSLSQAPITLDLVSRVGFPAVVLLVVLFQLVPRIDRGIQIADRVDGQLSVIAATCDLRPRRDTMVPLGPWPTTESDSRTTT